MRGIEVATANGVVTPDLGGKANTQDVTNAVVEAIRSAND
jgi:tartrate dehydrogenase/decarboxylase/D-malate dehydrogenase